MKVCDAVHSEHLCRSLLLASFLTGLILLIACASTTSDFIKVATEGNTLRLESLLLHGADVDATDEHGTTALMVAAANGHEDAVHLLLANRANVNATSYDGGTALMRAALGGHANIVRILLVSRSKT